MKTETLSDKRVPVGYEWFYPEKDVREFIKELKWWERAGGFIKIPIDEFNKLAGEELANHSQDEGNQNSSSLIKAGGFSKVGSNPTHPDTQKGCGKYIAMHYGKPVDCGDFVFGEIKLCSKCSGDGE